MDSTPKRMDPSISSHLLEMTGEESTAIGDEQDMIAQ
jgi:hypothetical protein